MDADFQRRGAGVGNWGDDGTLLPERLPELDFLELLCRGVGFGTGRRRCELEIEQAGAWEAAGAPDVCEFFACGRTLTLSPLGAQIIMLHSRTGCLL